MKDRLKFKKKFKKLAPAMPLFSPFKRRRVISDAKRC